VHGFACVFPPLYSRPAPVAALPEPTFAPALKVPPSAGRRGGESIARHYIGLSSGLRRLYSCRRIYYYYVHMFMNESMEEIVPYLKIIMPLVMIVFIFFLKLWVVQIPKAPDYLKAIIDLPISISFFGVAMCVSYSISASKNSSYPPEGVLFFAVSLLWSVLIIASGRCCIKLYSRSRWKMMGSCIVLNYILASVCALLSIKIIVGG